MILLSVGHAFETLDGRKGIVLLLDQEGCITSSRALWDQNFINKNFPGTITAMRPLYVLETDSVSNDRIAPGDIKRTFIVNPFPLATVTDMGGNGNAVVVGIVSSADKRPWTVSGVCEIPPNVLLKVLLDNARYFEGGISVALKAAVASRIEDAIRDMAWARTELAQRTSSIEMRGLQGRQVMVMLHHLGRGSNDGLTVEYRSNCLKMTFESWSHDALMSLMGRDATKTAIPKMTLMFEAGPPAFKWQMLPYDRLVVTFAFFKILNDAGTACNTHNEGTPAAIRELRSFLVDRRQCYFCFRRQTPDDPRHGCICTEESLFQVAGKPAAEDDS